MAIAKPSPGVTIEGATTSKGFYLMRKYLLAAVAAAAIASPAMARDGSGYVGIEGGILFPKDQDADLFVDYTTTQTPATPVVVGV
jgi:hypothetical protein